MHHSDNTFPSRKSKLPIVILCMLLFILAFSSVIGALLMIIRPDGSLLELRQEWLTLTPFSSYMIPGILLFFCCGLFPMLALIGLIFKPKWKYAGTLNIYPDIHWAWTYSLYSGIIIIMWIAGQLLLFPHLWLQPVLILMGIAIIIFSMLPSVIMRYK